MANPRRAIPLHQAEIEFREQDGEAVVQGYAAVYYRGSDPGTEFVISDGQMKERVMPGAFDRALAEGQDVVGLLNHDPNLVLGRTGPGTLRLSTNKRGLRYEITLPNTSYARDLAEVLRRGEMGGSSFAFRIRDQSWRAEDDVEIRELRDVDLVDVSPVTYPAYKATTSGLRAEDEAEALDALAARREHLERELQQERDEVAAELHQAHVAAVLASLD